MHGSLHSQGFIHDFKPPVPEGHGSGKEKKESTDASEAPKYIALLTEKHPQDLHQWLNRDNKQLQDGTCPSVKASLLQRLQFLIKVADGLWYMHEACKPEPHLHLDVKPANIVLCLSGCGTVRCAPFVPVSLDTHVCCLCQDEGDADGLWALCRPQFQRHV